MFPTARTRPGLPSAVCKTPWVVYAIVPAVGGARHLYVYSDETGTSVELNSDDEVNEASGLIDYARVEFVIMGIYCRMAVIWV